ncbi:uncharacterized protein FTOL_12437 [Fusarium torulosum]|uniref:Uncharacterized protein n=1 Tax=Fusarium torulosum TaxID=33205 RepID=A0AAE8SP81_9HYPO|nr:uncharacterized protein FTOL_12437 [Fusarium torulosum]
MLNARYSYEYRAAYPRLTHGYQLYPPDVVILGLTHGNTKRSSGDFGQLPRLSTGLERQIVVIDNSDNRAVKGGTQPVPRRTLHRIAATASQPTNLQPTAYSYQLFSGA